jgi:hypothetical protein
MPICYNRARIALMYVNCHRLQGPGRHQVGAEKRAKQLKKLDGDGVNLSCVIAPDGGRTWPSKGGIGTEQDSIEAASG